MEHGAGQTDSPACRDRLCGMSLGDDDAACRRPTNRHDQRKHRGRSGIVPHVIYGPLHVTVCQQGLGWLNRF